MKINKVFKYKFVPNKTQIELISNVKMNTFSVFFDHKFPSKIEMISQKKLYKATSFCLYFSFSSAVQLKSGFSFKSIYSFIGF